MVGQQALPADSKRLLELLPTRGTLRYFFWPASVLDADADKTRGALAMAREFGNAPPRMGAASVA
jgi:hypothetical protein